MAVDVKISVSSDQKLDLGGRLLMKKSVFGYFLRRQAYHALFCRKSSESGLLTVAGVNDINDLKDQNILRG